MAIFCPICTSPIIEIFNDPDPLRLCNVCGWAGDKEEALKMPPLADQPNPILVVAQQLALYRTACHAEIFLRGAYISGNITLADLQQAELGVQNCAKAIITLVMNLPLLPKQQLFITEGLLAWPEDWKDRHYNACNDPCDMLSGPCACGAWHSITDEWVQQKLKEHNVEIIL